MPEDVVSINGELYFDDLVPGHGFVTDVGLGGNPFAAASGTEAGTAEAASAPSVAPVDSSERQQIIDLFKQ
jgi:penicillin-binding protein 1A